MKHSRLPWRKARVADNDRLEQAQRDEQQRLVDARREHARVREQWPTVLQYVAVLTAHRERNHFAEAINQLFRGGHQ